MAIQNDERNDSVALSIDARQALRQRAEEQVRAIETESLPAPAPEQTERLLHELRVHQIELEVQNEELRRAQVELEASRARYFDLYDLAPVGYFTLSNKGIILEANLTAATLLETPRGALVRQPLARFILPEDQDAYYRHRQQLYKTDAPQVCELRMVRQGGNPFWARVEAITGQDADGAPVCRATMSDITERKRAEEALKEYSERLEIMVAERTHALEEAHERLLRQERLAVLGQLAGGVAHELRSPLATIENGVYFLNVVLDKPEPEVQETLDILSKEVGRSEGIIAGLLDFAHPKAPLRRPVDVNGVVRETLARIAAPANVKTTCQLDAVLPTILADPDQLLQVFSNLILNAIQAMPDGGELTVKTVATNPERVSIAIADTGSGIPHENLSKLFEPLFTTKSKGIGLGLAISKKLMEEHKGTIEVQSEEGQGTTFTVHLPVQETPAMPTSEVTS